VGRGWSRGKRTKGSSLLVSLNDSEAQLSLVPQELNHVIFFSSSHQDLSLPSSATIRTKTTTVVLPFLLQTTSTFFLLPLLTPPRPGNETNDSSYRLRTTTAKELGRSS